MFALKCMLKKQHLLKMFLYQRVTITARAENAEQDEK
jgi:hypothetical protein